MVLGAGPRWGRGISGPAAEALPTAGSTCENEEPADAYSWGAYGTYPYVLMNYQDNQTRLHPGSRDGACAAFLIRIITSLTCTPVTGFFVAGGFHLQQALLIRHLMTAKDRKEKNVPDQLFLEQFRTTLYQQTMFAEFESSRPARSPAAS